MNIEIQTLTDVLIKECGVRDSAYDNLDLLECYLSHAISIGKGRSGLPITKHYVVSSFKDFCLKNLSGEFFDLNNKFDELVNNFYNACLPKISCIICSEKCTEANNTTCHFCPVPTNAWICKNHCYLPVSCCTNCAKNFRADQVVL